MHIVFCVVCFDIVSCASNVDSVSGLFIWIASSVFSVVFVTSTDNDIIMGVCIQSELHENSRLFVHSTRLFQLCVYMTLRLIIVLNEDEVWRVLG